MPGKKFFTIALCSLLLAAAGCKKSSNAAPAPVKNYTTIDWANSGTISGAIHFTGKPPKPILIDMAQDPVCSLASSNYTKQYIVSGKGLQNVFVYIKSGLGDKAYAPPSTPVVMDQKGCQYIPHVVGVMVGQPVQFTNSDATMHNVHITPTDPKNQTVDISEAPNSSGESRTLSAPELMVPVRCNNHPWMEAFINAVDNPFYGVSGNAGSFTIKGVPPGTYTLVADHEVLGQKSATITVEPHKTTTVDFTYAIPAAAN